MNLTGRLTAAFALLCLATGCQSDPEGDSDGGLKMDAGKRPDAGRRDASTAGPDAGPDGGLPGEPDGGPGPDDPCLEPTGSGPAGTETLGAGAEMAQVAIEDPSRCLRKFTLTTSVPRLDDRPANPRVFEERPGQPTARTHNAIFDALYALALEEMRENSVAKINDGSFDDNKDVLCPEGGCFETGANWHYVWTRDTAYAVDLALGALDPTRARNSLEFKLSERRTGGDLQIVQDTGTGGSWPVSTDRVSWALGAWELLKWLDGAERTAFRDRAYEAIRNTLEHDRATVFDPVDGLYTGEQSFLDWREQTYPDWTRLDPVQIGMSKALSTNLLHLQAMRVAAELAGEKGEAARRDRYQGWAAALASAIGTRFRLEDGRWSTFSTTFLDPAPTRRYDLLASALAVRLGVADAAQAAELVAKYPHAGKGPPTIWPQQQDTPIYHNRSFWPFVTAYWLGAGRQVRNDKVVDHGVLSLLRGAAFSLSNMENFELITGRTRVEEGATSGPVVNSTRQLWSVAGYLHMVQSVVFGLEASQQGVRALPYVTRRMRHEIFGGADRIVLNRFPYRGKRLTVVVLLPAKSASREGAYAVGAVKLDGVEVGQAFLAPGQLPASGVLEVTLVDDPAQTGATMEQVLDTAEYKNLFGPRTPGLAAIGLKDGKLELTIERGNEKAEDVTFSVYRDGARVASGLPGSTTTWLDPESADHGTKTHCYAVESVFVLSGNHSQRSRPLCSWGRAEERIQLVSARDFKNTGGEGILNHGQYHFQDWGDPAHSLEIAPLRPNFTGEHLLQLVYGNGLGTIDTGITCAVKRVTVEELPAGTVVAQGYVFMPHLASWSEWRDSSILRARLDAAKEYRVRVDGEEKALNMSAFKHFELYTGNNGTGGKAGANNRVNISALKLLALEGGSASPPVVFDGVDDLGKFPATARVAPGIKVESWEDFAIAWDAEHLYVAVVAKKFGDDGFRPYMLYVQAEGGTFAAPAARAGLVYDGQTANVPFQANYLVAVRRTSDAGDVAGPWNGLFRHDGTQWVRQTRFAAGRDYWVGNDSGNTLAFRLPRAQLGKPSKLRIAGHLIAGGGNYNDVIPDAGGPQHQPWVEGKTDGFLEIDLAGSGNAADWVHR